MDRRRLLQSLAAGLTVAVAGCGGDNDTPDESPPSQTPPDTTGPTDTATPTPTPEQTPTPTSEPTATPTPAQTQTPEQTPTPTPEQTPTPTSEPTATPTPAQTPTATPIAQVVEVGAGNGFAYAPESFTVAVGDTVEWQWVGSNHNVTADSVPDGADWGGTAGAPGQLFDRGHTYRYTFEVAGEYRYYCAPHESVGMVGSFTVTE